jgi:hypothetical protein
MTEIELHQPENALVAQMDYARAVAVSSLLPSDYRGKPENVLIAMGLGESMGLSPAESLYRISVIQGKPTANAELIAASVRKAGHKLRVTGDDTTCTATIVRHDDPDYEFSVTRDVAWARAMGLANKDNYKKQPGTMLQWRAITAVARLACSEALYGVIYTPDEMFDMSAGEPPAERQTGRDRLDGALKSGGQVSVPDPDAPPLMNDEPDFTPDPITPAQIKHLSALVTDLNLTREQKIAGAAEVIGRPIESTKDLSKDEATKVIKSLKATLAAVETVQGELMDEPA